MRDFVLRSRRYVVFVLAFVLALSLVSPVVTLNGAETERPLHVGGRANSWDGVDIHRDGMEIGDVITVTGRVDGVPPEGTQMVLGGAENPWNWAANMSVGEENQAFTLQLTLQENHIEEEQFVRFRIQTNGEGAAMSFFIYEILHVRDGDVVFSLNEDAYILGADFGTETDLNNVQALQRSGSPVVSIGEPAEPAEAVTLPAEIVVVEEEEDETQDIEPVELGPLQNVHNVTFDGDNWAVYGEFIAAGAQMEGSVVDYRGFDDNYSIRLENVTGDYTSGDGNYLNFTLPESLPIGSTVEISWWVYVPSDENPGDRVLVGPGININGQFGSAPHQPTNTMPAPGDLARVIPMDEWVNTTVEFTLGPDVGGVDFLIFRFRVNNDEQQPSVLYIDNISISTRGVAEVVIPVWDLSLPSLAETFADYFMIGNIWSNAIQMNIGNTQEMFAHHFNSVTAENHHKPDFIAGPGPDPATWNFATQDLIVDFAEANNMAVVGHTLVWHGQSPLWLTNVPGTTDPLTRAEAMENMHLYISTVAGRYAGRMQAWDVLNEAIASSVGEFSGDWRNHIRRNIADTDAQWYAAFANGAAEGEAGYDFIFYAFYFARQYDPHATLFYNDYNEEQPGKRDAIAQMVEYMNERWANHPSYDGRLLIEGIGLQSHHHLDQWATNFDNIRPAIERFAQTGAVLAITELDITVGTQANPSIPLSAAQEARQAEHFARVFAYFMEFSDYIERVTFWGKTDSQSWRAWGSPVIFDGDFGAKDSFHAIVNLVGQQAVTLPAPLVADDAEPAHVRLFVGTSDGFEDVGRGIDLSAFMDVPAQIVGGELLLPLRAVALALGAPEPVWNESTREVTVSFNGRVTTLTPVIVNSRSMVSVDFIIDFFQAAVDQTDDEIEIVT